MLSPGPAKKVTIHVNRDTSAGEDYLSQEIISFLFGAGIAGATVFYPAAGFGSHHRIHTDEGGSNTGQHMPVRIEFIEIAEKVAEVSPMLCELLTDGLIEVQDTVILKAASGTAR